MVLVSENDVRRFAEWSGDRNPLHVDEGFASQTIFGRPIVHGVLSAIGALSSTRTRPLGPLRSLEVEFRGAVVPDSDYGVEAENRETELFVRVRSGDGVLLTIRGEYGQAIIPPLKSGLSWMTVREADSRVLSVHRRDVPADRAAEDLQRGVEVTGVYATDPPPQAYTAHAHLSPVDARVLGLQLPDRNGAAWTEVALHAAQPAFRCDFR
jgi:hypothetical protein